MRDKGYFRLSTFCDSVHGRLGGEACQFNSHFSPSILIIPTYLVNKIIKELHLRHQQASKHKTSSSSPNSRVYYKNMATPDNVRPLRAWVRNEYPLRFEEAVGLISEAVQRGLPTNRNQYQSVAVLMFHWQHDDIGVVPLENEMAQLFEQLFNYRVERYIVEPYPSMRNSQRTLSDRLTAFRNKYEGPQNLLIYVYSGHAWSGSSSFECLL